MIASPPLDPPHTEADTWRVPASLNARAVTLPDAQALLRELNTWILSRSTSYGADPGEAFDASNSLVEVTAWLADLASRQRITT